MADDGVTKEAMRQMPLDVMVATFADRQAAKDAYKTLKTMDKQGTIALDGAIVIDRNEMGKVHLEGAKLPGWVWGLFIGIGSLMLGMVGLVAWLGVMAARGMRSSMEQRAEGGDYSKTGSMRQREHEREGVRMSME